MNGVKARLVPEVVAMRIVKELREGECVNLGVGIGNLAGAFIPEEKNVVLHSEVGVIGHGRILGADEWELMDFDLLNAGVFFIAPKPGMSVCDFAEAFDAIRVGRVDTSILGAYQVSEKGDLANWVIDPTGVGAAIGGAMDVAIGVKRVIVGMTHTTKDGRPKIVKECSMPLTARAVVNTIVTDVAVIDIVQGHPLLRELAPGWTLDDVQAITEPQLVPAPDLKEVEL